MVYFYKITIKIWIRRSITNWTCNWLNLCMSHFHKQFWQGGFQCHRQKPQKVSYWSLLEQLIINSIFFLLNSQIYSLCYTEYDEACLAGPINKITRLTVRHKSLINSILQNCSSLLRKKDLYCYYLHVFLYLRPLVSRSLREKWIAKEVKEGPF